MRSANIQLAAAETELGRKMTPQEYSLELAKRLQATAMLAEGLLWSAFVMRSWDAVDDLLGHAVENAERLRDPPVPFLAQKAGIQLEALIKLRPIISSRSPDWHEIQRIAHHLLESLQTDFRGKPGKDTSLADYFRNRPTLPRNPWGNAATESKRSSRKRPSRKGSKKR